MSGESNRFAMSAEQYLGKLTISHRVESFVKKKTQQKNTLYISLSLLK